MSVAAIVKKDLRPTPSLKAGYSASKKRKKKPTVGKTGTYWKGKTNAFK